MGRRIERPDEHSDADQPGTSYCRYEWPTDETRHETRITLDYDLDLKHQPQTWKEDTAS